MVEKSSGTRPRVSLIRNPFGKCKTGVVGPKKHSEDLSKDEKKLSFSSEAATRLHSLAEDGSYSVRVPGTSVISKK